MGFMGDKNSIQLSVLGARNASQLNANDEPQGCRRPTVLSEDARAPAVAVVCMLVDIARILGYFCENISLELALITSRYPQK